MDNDIYQYFQRLEGEWKVTRDIEKFGKAIGTAKFTLVAPDRLNYREDLKVIAKEVPSYEAYREYIYTYDQSSNKMNIFFNDMKLFIPLKYSKKNLFIGEHLCAKDNYKMSLAFEEEDKFTIIYDINGPEKNFNIKSYYIHKKRPLTLAT